MVIDGPLSWSPPWVTGLVEEETGPLTRRLCGRAGKRLLVECISSVSYLYRDVEAKLQLPGPVPTPNPWHYEFTDLGSCATIAEACKALDCFEYQSCEHPGWEGSGAERFCRRFRASLTSVLPGSAYAPWEWSVETLAGRQLIPSQGANGDPGEEAESV
jgi:hypothetical protein